MFTNLFFPSWWWKITCNPVQQDKVDNDDFGDDVIKAFLEEKKAKTISNDFEFIAIVLEKGILLQEVLQWLLLTQEPEKYTLTPTFESRLSNQCGQLERFQD